jgi:Leucine-rich repeat (LRR) protein
MAVDEAYREAEQRIEAARESGATELDLSGLGLTELPDSIANLTALQTLDLTDNQLTRLPDSIAQLQKLRSSSCRLLNWVIESGRVVS